MIHIFEDDPTYLFISPLRPRVPGKTEGQSKKANDQHRPEQPVCDPEPPVEDIRDPVDRRSLGKVLGGL